MGTMSDNGTTYKQGLVRMVKKRKGPMLRNVPRQFNENEENDDRMAYLRGEIGPPRQKAGDQKTERIGLRLHRDLDFEARMAARNEGVSFSSWIVKAMARAVNERADQDLLDNFGRYKDWVVNPPMPPRKR